MGLSEEIRQRLINSFKTEQAEHVQKINQGLLALEKSPANQQELLKEIFREAHSLKGAARAVGLTTIESLGHALEEVLLGAKEGRLSFSAELFDLLYQALDAVEAVLVRVEAGDSTPSAEVLALLARLEAAGRPQEPKTRQPEPETRQPEPETRQPEQREPERETATAQQLGAAEEPGPLLGALIYASDRQQPAAAEEPAPEQVNKERVEPGAAAVRTGAASDETIRVSVSKLDALMGQFSELLGAKIRAEQRLAEVQQMQTVAAEWHKVSLGLRSQTNRLLRSNQNNGQRKDMAALLSFTVSNQEQLRALSVQANGLYRQLANDTLRLSLIIDELQDEIKRVRMLPLSTITTTFGRMVRDLAREQGKLIDLEIEGGETELDKRVLEQIKDPLMHLLRNAVDHGLEKREARIAAGKAEEGRIVLSASQQGNNVVIRVIDDGGGLDLEAIRTSAARKGLMPLAEARKLSDGEVAALIFSSGLSTSKIITDISGRGVGLDVVRQNVEELHGTLEVGFEAGQGTWFTLTLPLTLASSRGLLVRAGGQTFALPLSTVERMLQVKREKIRQVEGKDAISYQGRPVAVARLDELLELPQREAGSAQQSTVVIVAVAEKRLGLLVDELAGEQEIVMKNLGKQLAKVGGIAGATVLGNGQVILVLHAGDLVKLAGRQATRQAAMEMKGKQELKQSKRVLVVDDSITTRTLEKNILEAAGYQVRLATDGEEAFGLLGVEGPPHLIVSDINMPRLDGFELAQRVKQDVRYSEIPVILVTSLDSPADKARGIEVGADAYIVKSQFDQGNLLDTIEQLIG